jgi:hypothetical protein
MSSNTTEQQTAVGHSDIDPAMLDSRRAFGRRRGHGPRAVQDRGEMAGLSDVDDDENGYRKVRRQSGHHGAERLLEARRAADDDDNVACRGCLP